MFFVFTVVVNKKISCLWVCLYETPKIALTGDFLRVASRFYYNKWTEKKTKTTKEENVDIFLYFFNQKFSFTFFSQNVSYFFSHNLLSLIHWENFLLLIQSKIFFTVFLYFLVKNLSMWIFPFLLNFRSNLWNYTFSP